MDPLLLSYLAGSIDCDGFITISIRNRTRADGSLNIHYLAVLGLGQITPLIPELMQATFGGRINRYVYKNRPNSQTAHNWQVTNAAAATALIHLRPYLRLKARQADIALDFCRGVDPKKFGRPLAISEKAERARLRDAIVSLNALGRRHAAPPIVCAAGNSLT